MWTVGQTVFQEVRTPEERMHKRAGKLRRLTITRCDAVGRCFIEGAGYFDHLGSPLDYYGTGIIGDSIQPWSDALQVRFQVQQAAAA